MEPDDPFDEIILIQTEKYGKIRVDKNCAIGQNIEIGQGLEYIFDIQNVEHECESELGLSATNIRFSTETKNLNEKYFENFEKKLLDWECQGQAEMKKKRKNLKEKSFSTSKDITQTVGYNF